MISRACGNPATIYVLNTIKLELMFMKHYAPNRCLYIKVAKLRTGVGSAEMSHLRIRVDVIEELKFL